jgi:hypothetical protein
MADALFDTITRFQAGRPWGRLLDAGTGKHSLGWIRGLETVGWTAVTGDPARERALRSDLGDALREGDRVVTGNWTDPLLEHGEVYDTVLADYLLGAVDGFAPYFQDQLFARLRRHTAGLLYVVGQEPYPDHAETEGGRLILEIARLRDACILLAGHRCYREFPRDWVVRSLEGAGFEVQDAVSIPIVYRARFIDGQLDVCLRKLPRMADPSVAASLREHINELRARALAVCARDKGILFGSDHVVAARPR